MQASRVIEKKSISGVCSRESKTFFVTKKATHTVLWASKEANKVWVILRMVTSIEKPGLFQ